MEIARVGLIKIIAGSVVSVVIGTYLFLYRPVICKFKKQHLACSAIESKVRQAQEAIASIETKDKKVILLEEDVSVGIDELTRMAKSKGLSIISVTPRQIEVKEAGYKILPIEMEVVSDYEALGTFLGGLDKLEKSLVNVDSFNMVAEQEKTLGLRTKLVINIYLAAGEWAGQMESVFPQRTAQKTDYDSWLRSPFTLQKTSTKISNGLILNGIMWDKETPLAIINNDIVQTGDNISGNIVVEIKQDRVILNNGSGNFELRL